MSAHCHMAVDIGNSGARVVRLPDDLQTRLPEPLRITWRKETEQPSSIQQFHLPEQSVWEDSLLPFIQPTMAIEWWLSSVHRSACASLVTYLQQFSNCQIRMMDYRQIPLEIEVEFPDRVGIDRLLAAYAASQWVAERPLMVIQAGSAVTVDLVEQPGQATDQPPLPGRFSGGAILPGVPMMLRLLASAADLLPKVEAAELIELPPLPGRSSQAAMLAGASSCLVGGVQHLIGRYRQTYGSRVPIVLSGGDGPLLLPHLTQPIIEVEHLVLQGLRILAHQITKPC